MSIGSVAGVLMVIDPVGALVVVAASELAIKARRPLLQRGGDKLPLGLLYMARMGIIYGLLLEGVKSSI